MSTFVIPADARSWIDVASNSDFPIQNLPYCSYAAERCQHGSIAVRIGDFLVDLYELAEAGLLPGFEFHFCIDFQETLEHAGRESLAGVRKALFELLLEGNDTLKGDEGLRAKVLIPIEHAQILMPITPNAFVDFYSGIHHASNVGRMFRPDQPPLLPNYRHLPVGYNGRASSVVVSGTEIHRPKCQTKGPNDEMPTYGPSKELDFELELGFITGKGNEMGVPIPIAEAEDYIFGIVLVNDWSARDTQRWEYQPLGPFLSKSFATTISPYVVSLDALEPFRIAGPVQEPAVLPHLQAPRASHYNIRLEVAIQTAKMTRPQVICRSNAQHLYWSFVQQLAHQASNGTPVEAADLYATGTISGTAEGSFGSLLELTWRGTKPLTLEETGETRTFLEDGDELILTGYCQGDGYRIGFGECRGRVLPSL